MKKLFTLFALLSLSLMGWADSNICGVAPEHPAASGSTHVLFSWNTADNGDVVVSIAPGEGTTSASFRGSGFTGDVNQFKVLSGEGFATEENASKYFYEKDNVNGQSTYTLYRTGTYNLPSPCKIRYTPGAIEWSADGIGPYDNSSTIIYDYGTVCGSTLDAPVIAVDESGIVSFDDVSGADSYRAYVYSGAELIKECPVISGQKVWNPYYSGDYAIRVRSFNSSTNAYSDFSNGGIWSATGSPSGDKPKSQYCDKEMDRASNYPTVTNDQHSLVGFTWETLPNGNVLISLSEKDGGEPGTALFRGNGMNIANFYIDGVQNNGDNAIFETEASHANLDYYTLIVKEGKSAPADRAHITYNGTVEYKTATSTDAWPTLSFDYTYGRNCDEVDDHVAPEVTLTKVSMTTTSATLQIDITEVNDYSEIRPLRSFTIRDAANSFAEQKVSLNASNQMTLEDLKKNTIYNFTVKAVDSGGNVTEKTIKVPLTFDPNDNLAKGKDCEAGCANGGDVASKANDGNNADGNWWGTYNCDSKDGFVDWPTANTWEIDLGQAYVLDKVSIYAAGFGGTAKHDVTLQGKMKSEDAWSTIFADMEVLSGETYINVKAIASAKYLKFSAAGSGMIAIKEFEIFGHDYAVPDAVVPVVAVSEISKTVNSVTLQIVASDKDDAGNDGTINAINISGDNGFVTQNNIVLDESNRITLSELTYNKTYHFTVQAVDLAGNDATQDIEVVLPFNTKLNLAKNKTCSAGGAEKPATNANDGNPTTFWGTYNCTPYALANVWEVDLEAVYVLDSAAIYTDGFDGHSAHIMTLKGKKNAGDDWFVIFDDLSVSASSSYRNVPAVADAQYLQFSADKDWMIAVKEFEVYGHAFAAPDATNPTVSVTCPAKTINSATLQISAADLVDGGATGSIVAINISGDNGFVAQKNVSLDESNQITLDGLKDNTTYTFTVTVLDRAHNEASANIEVVLPFNTDLNLALNKTDVAGGYCQFGANTEEGHYAEYRKANDGNRTASGYSAYGAPSTDDAWWSVNLGDIYDLSHIDVYWHNEYSTGYAIYGSLDNTNWYLIGKDAATEAGLKSTIVNAPAQYVKVHSYGKKNVFFYEVEVYASGFSTFVDTKPVITYAAVAEVEDNMATIEVGGVDMTTTPVTWQISGIGESPIVKSAVDNVITIDELTSNTAYNITLYAKDDAGNLSEGKALSFSTTGAAAGLFLFSDYFGWGNKDQARAQFNTTVEPGVLSLAITNMTAGGHNFKLYNGTIDRCTKGDCGGVSDHHIYNASAVDVTFYATSEDRFICTLDELYLHGTLVGEDQALVWNDAHTIASWTGAIDLSGTKQFTVVKKNQVGETLFTYDHDFYTEVQTFDGDYTYGTFTLDLTKMTGTWSYVGLSFADDAVDNETVIAANADRIANVTLNRSILADNTWYTLCLPFDMDADKVNEVFGASTIAQLTGSEDRGSLIHLNFDYADAIEAGRAYLIMPGQNFVSGSTISGVTIENVDPEALKSSCDHMYFQGTFNKITLNNENQRFVGENNYLYSPNSVNGSPVGAFRCFFTIRNDAPAGAPGKRACIVFSPQHTTDIDNISEHVAPAKFMLDGVLYIIRDGRTYNAQGMLVE